MQGLFQFSDRETMTFVPKFLKIVPPNARRPCPPFRMRMILRIFERIVIASSARE
jgi:hypothetical protein